MVGNGRVHRPFSATDQLLPVPVVASRCWKRRCRQLLPVARSVYARLKAKAQYRARIEAQLATNDTHQVWQGLQCITQHKQKATALSDVRPDLPNELNNFYCRFDDKNPEAGYRPPLPVDSLPLSLPFIIHELDVRRLFKKQNTRKASGPDRVSAYTLRSCADQLAPVFTDILNISLQLRAVPVALNHQLLCLCPLKKPKWSS